MSKPHIHAQSSVRKYGGKEEDYLPIHQHMDSTKGCIADNRHRVLTHNSWYISANGPLELIFGVVIINSEGRKISVRDIGEQHILEDFGGRFIPTPQDWLEQLPMQPWMNNGKGEPPPSYKVLEKKTKEVVHDMPSERHNTTPVVYDGNFGGFNTRRDETFAEIVEWAQEIIDNPPRNPDLID